MTDPDCSVRFNLEELMRMEGERAAAEDEARQEAQARRAERARRAEERARTAQAELERQALEQVQVRAQREAELATEREARLLEVRLQAEARERSEQARLALARERELRALDDGRPGSPLPGFLAGAAIAIGVAAFAYVAWVEPTLSRAQDQRREALALAERHDRELAAMRQRGEALQQMLDQRAMGAAKVGDPSLETTAERPPPRTSGTAAPGRRGVGRRPAAARAGSAREEDPLGDLDEESKDPLHGMVEPSRGRRGRR